ncbi:MAG: hypothetical protein JW394_0798 [Nitrospira sp.]|nr:hypothetical protein [Nitrospira sp.]
MVGLRVHRKGTIRLRQWLPRDRPQFYVWRTGGLRRVRSPKAEWTPDGRPDEAGSPTGSAGSASPRHRNPILLFRFVGWLLLRTEERALIGLLFQAPPRNTVDCVPLVTTVAQYWGAKKNFAASPPAGSEFFSQRVKEKGKRIKGNQFPPGTGTQYCRSDSLAG